MNIEELKRKYPELQEEIDAKADNEKKEKLAKEIANSIANKPIIDAAQRIAKYFSR